MKNRSYSATALLTLASICLLLMSSLGKGQTLSCDGLSFDGGWGGGGFSMDLPFRADAFCNNGPGEQVLYRSGDGSMVVTARSVLHLDGQGLRVEAGGTANCTNFPKQMVITFSQPVANFEVGILGARTATDNRGYTVHMSPPLYPEGAVLAGRPMMTAKAFFPGAGITSITISDPIETDIDDGGYSVEGFWEMWVINGRWISESRYKQCGCGQPAITRPAAQTISSNWPLVNGIDSNWSMQAEVTDNDGLVLRDIRLGQRYMAESISVPYYTLETNNAQGGVSFQKRRGELKPNSTDASMRSRLVNYYVTTDDQKLVVEATYLVDQIPSGSQSCLHITQRYEFYKMVPGDHCEPSGTLPCTRWKPIVKYLFFGLGGESIRSINVVQRQHLTIDNNRFNSVGLFRDKDSKIATLLDADGFEKRSNPLGVEWEGAIVNRGKDAKEWDNVHQTYKGMIEEPYPTIDFSRPFPYYFIHPGCPECGHMHWRWGAISGGEGEGRIIGIPSGSTQDLNFAVTLNRPGEEHPTNYTDLLAFPRDAIRTWSPSGRNPLQIDGDSAPEDVVYWQSGTGYENSDAFFGYGSFFNPSLPNQQLYERETAPTAQQSVRSSLGASSLALTESAQDGLSSIVAAHLYTDGATTVEPFDSTLAGSLPSGYSLYNNLSYDVKTEGESSGPFTLSFDVASVTDQAVFDNLRVFHVEKDPHEPDKVIWVDRTILSPDPQAPDFASKTINAKANFLGQYVVASLTQPQSPSTAVADVALSSSDSSDPVVVNNSLTYTLTITNNGAQTATGVTLTDSLAPEVIFTSVASTEGSCAEEDGRVVCKLDTLNVGASAVVTIVVKLRESRTGLPPTGTVITNTALARANEADTNQANNSSTETTTVMPDANASPTVNITSPVVGEMFVGPANINISATASDSDGSVSKVEFYDDGSLIGTGQSQGSGQYTIAWNNVAFGKHFIVAVATDNLGKTRSSDPVSLVVNGSATVSINSPAKWEAFNRSATINLTATASLGGGSISKTEFYANGALIGEGTASSTGQYTFTWNNPFTGTYTLTAVATDDAGVTTTSTPVTIKVNDVPVVRLTSPTPGALFSASSNILLTANASDGDGSVTKVDFYANGSLIGTSATMAASQFSFNWSNAAAGSYSLTAVARDDSGGTTTSSPVSINVNAPPSVSVTSPAYGAQFTPPANVTLTATASDSDGSIGQVNFYANGTLVGAGTATGANQYSYTWNNVAIGSYLITAKATDNSGTTTTSGAISITVNNPPAVSLASPLNGSTFAAPATITINANASDSDGSVAKVEFFQNSVKLGEDSTSPYSFTWNNVGAGSYSLTAVATDNLGSISTSSPVNITVKPSALFVTGSTTLNSSDAAVQTRLQTLGYAVTVKDAKAALSTDANGKAVVVISSTVSPTNLSTKFRTVTVPVVIWESLSYFDIGMTAKGTTAAGTATGQTQVKIAQPTHPLAAGLTGTQTVVTVSSTFGWGKPSASAAAVATLVSDPTKIIIFGYDKGAAMPGLAAPARRVGIFMNDTTAASFNGNGWALFDAAVNWATTPTP
jgi:uncharacterized repeat protein (TIGR01451 family)